MSLKKKIHKEKENKEISVPSPNNQKENFFKDLSKFNGEINRMNIDQLIEKLKYFGLDTEGSEEILKKRLKNNYRKMKLNSVNFNKMDQLPPYFVIIDFEATCNQVNLPTYQQEIIEFPAVLVCSTNQEIVDIFHMYCKPNINPILSDFCTKLTGITQDQVDSAADFKVVLDSFYQWLNKHSLGKKHNFAIVTDSSWDMCRFLYDQCQFCSIPFPKWGQKWVNIKRTFANFYKHRRLRLTPMLEYVGLQFEGRLHCGLDDAKNIARLLIRMLRDGANVHVNEKIKTGNRRQNKVSRVRANENDITRCNQSLNGNNSSVKKHNEFSVRAYYMVIESKGELSTYDKVKRNKRQTESSNREEPEEECSMEEMDEIYQWVQSCPLVKSDRKKLANFGKKRVSSS